MGKTYRRIPGGSLRNPRGKKQAVILGFRAGAVPPSAWDDLVPTNDVFQPYKVARRFKACGMHRDEAIRIIRRRFRLTLREAELVTYMW